jgi:hypothetical protein
VGKIACRDRQAYGAALRDFAHAVGQRRVGIALVEVIKKFNRRAGAMPTLQGYFRREIG